MAEYIDREAAYRAICNDGTTSGYEKAYCSELIKNIPAADVAPVRHGRWFDKGEYAVCMECGGRSGTQYDGVEPIPLMTQFCPNCGCRMDGGDDE